MNSSLAIRVSMLLGSIAISLTGSVMAAAAPAKVAVAKAYEVIEHWPDWSGVWILHRDQAAINAAGGNAMQLTPKYAELQRIGREQRSQGNLSSCLPAGATAILQHTIMFEFLYAPGEVLMLFENGEVRRIYTDGREHKSLDELRRSYEGDSIGSWQGNTLVVDTIGFPNGELWENYGVRATKNTHLIERIHRTEQGEIEIDSIISDPEIFTTPYAYTRRYRAADFELSEPVCAQNNRDTGTDIDLTPPSEE